MTAPSELAQSIYEWVNDNDVQTFSTEDVYNALDFIDNRKDVSEALRYMFKKRMVGRDRKDAKGFWYALADVAPSHFEFYETSTMAHNIENAESKDMETVTTGYAQVEEIKEASNAEADDIESIDLTTGKWKNQICVGPETIKLFSDQEAKKKTANDLSNDDTQKIVNDAWADISQQELQPLIWHKISQGYDGISNSPLDFNIHLSENLKNSYKEKSEPVDSIQIGGDHYKTMAIQPWNALKEWMTEEQFSGFLKGNAIVYLARCDSKGGLEDIKKARHCLDKLIEVSENGK